MQKSAAGTQGVSRRRRRRSSNPRYRQKTENAAESVALPPAHPAGNALRSGQEGGGPSARPPQRHETGERLRFEVDHAEPARNRRRTNNPKPSISPSSASQPVAGIDTTGPSGITPVSLPARPAFLICGILSPWTMTCAGDVATCRQRGCFVRPARAARWRRCPGRRDAAPPARPRCPARPARRPAKRSRAPACRTGPSPSAWWRDATLSPAPVTA